MMEGCVASLAEGLRALDWDEGGNRAALARYWMLFWALRRRSAWRSALTSVAQSTPLSPSCLETDVPRCQIVRIAWDADVHWPLSHASEPD
jgi:hypothetical protein